MSLLSMIGFLLFVILCMATKTIIQPYLYQPPLDFTKPNGDKVNIPEQQPNYLKIIMIGLIVLAFLIFVSVATVYLWKVGPGICSNVGG